MLPRKRTAADFVELVYEQVLIDIYQCIPSVIQMKDGAPIYRSKDAKNGVGTTKSKSQNGHQTQQT